MADLLSRLALRSFGPDERAVRQRLFEYLPDIQVALEWFIDHRQWEQAMQVSLAGQGITDRASSEMYARLHGAVLASGDDVDFIDLLQHVDTGQSAAESEATVDARGLAHGACGPTDSPRPILTTSSVAAGRSQRQLRRGRGTGCQDEPLQRFEQLVEELNSDNATGGIAELRGHLAVAGDDWSSASRWFAEASDSQSMEHPNWYRLAVSWHALTAKAITGQQVTGFELREPWRWFRSEGINVLGWHGAVSSAVALDRLGRKALAERLVHWARQSDPGGVMARFERTLAAAGLYVERAESADDLEELIDEVIAIADELDRQVQRVAADIRW